MTTTADTRTSPVSARIPHEDAEALQAIAHSRDSTVSRLIARCVREQLPHLQGRPVHREHERTA